MLTIAKELDAALRRLDPNRAKRLEDLVRDAVALAEQTAPVNGPVTAWPAGYFEETAGAFAGEELQRPPQGELPQRDDW
jgi:hypothetical protein